MFTDATFDSLPTERHRRGWATLTSFGLQAILVTCMMTLPLYYTQVIPLVVPTSTLLLVPHSDPAPVPQPTHQPPSGNPGGGSTYHSATWIVPNQIPTTIYTGPDPGPLNPPDIGPLGPSSGAGPYIPGAIGNGAPQVMPPKPEPPRVIRISRMSEGSLVHRVEPVYPQLAKIAHIEGQVEIAALIGRDGTIQSLQVLSGHPYLAKAARDAVAQWRYKPYILNDAAVEVETRVTVNFVLSR